MPLISYQPDNRGLSLMDGAFPKSRPGPESIDHETLVCSQLSRYPAHRQTNQKTNSVAYSPPF